MPCRSGTESAYSINRINWKTSGRVVMASSRRKKTVIVAVSRSAWKGTRAVTRSPASSDKRPSARPDHAASTARYVFTTYPSPLRLSLSLIVLSCELEVFSFLLYLCYINKFLLFLCCISIALNSTRLMDRQLKPLGHVCRISNDECDLPEVCDGRSGKVRPTLTKLISLNPCLIDRQLFAF